MINCPSLVKDMEFSLEETERKFRRACEQIVLLNFRLKYVENRYTKAKLANLRNFRYNYRLQLAVVEGVRNMYHDYARMQAEKITELREQLYGEIIQIQDGEDTDDSDEDSEDDE
ncbi:hypothetical protein FSP39_005394 [Pinctada imbricata]|uniref:Uncharacterized protein n=1 Tax=Pinctada imbricata TaxID=66713 RepID=A0AA89C300_PINIB|nr:hypothetical protein FSP39_005394 [Pinctada imbricata]